MKIIRLETWTVSVPYLHDEISSRVARSGVTDTIVKLTADNGLVGWGECTSGPNAASIEEAVEAFRPLLLGRDPWQSEAIARDFFKTALWDLRAPSGNFAFAGIDQALIDDRVRSAQRTDRLLNIAQPHAVTINEILVLARACGPSRQHHLAIWQRQQPISIIDR